MKRREESQPKADESAGVSLDPMCGKPVIEEDAERFEFKKRTYYFCSEGCKGRFERQAERIHVRELARVGNLFGSRKVRWGVA